MNTRRKLVPSYLPHKQSGRARAVWTDALGVRQQKLLPGPFDSSESRIAFARLQLELETRPAVTATPHATLSINEVLLAYLSHADGHYHGPDGEPTDEVRHVKTVCRHVREVYGSTPAAVFGPLALKAVRQRFVNDGWCRKTVNARVERVRRIFKWAVAEELVPPSVHHALAAVAGLQRGRTPARETEPVGPVADAAVDATLPFLNRHVRGLVEFQRLTGCRPSEACRVRKCDLDLSGAVWLYRPAHHKTAWRGKVRSIPVGAEGAGATRAVLHQRPDRPPVLPGAGGGRAAGRAGRRPEDTTISVAHGPQRGQAGERAEMAAGRSVHLPLVPHRHHPSLRPCLPADRRTGPPREGVGGQVVGAVEGGAAGGGEGVAA